MDVRLAVLRDIFADDLYKFGRAEGGLMDDRGVFRHSGLHRIIQLPALGVLHAVDEREVDALLRFKIGFLVRIARGNDDVAAGLVFVDLGHNVRDDGLRLGGAERLIDEYDIRSGQGAATITRSMSGGNQQKAIIAREVDRDKPLIIAVQPTRGLDVGAIEYIHKQLVAQRDAGKAVLLVSLELDEVMSLSDRILVMYEGQIVGELDPKQTTVQELGLYMSGAKRSGKDGESA